MSSNSDSDMNRPSLSESEELDEESETSSTTSSSGMEQVASRLRSRKKKNASKPGYYCRKIMLPDHLAAYMEERELERDIEPIQCSADIIEKVFSNYLIVKNILSQLRWQEKLICKDVCPLWNDVINILQVEQNHPVDFSTSAGWENMREGVNILKSSEFHTEPLAVFTFCNAMGDHACSIPCQAIMPSPCLTACEDQHDILDIIHHETSAPNDCMFTVKGSSMSYMPLPHSPTMRAIKNDIDSAIYGIYIPKIPGMEFRTININCSLGIQQDLLPEIKKLTENYTVKGVVAFLTENYLLYVDETNAECLAFLNAMQTDVPFAFGGCLVEDTATSVETLLGIIDCVNRDKEFVSGNIMSLGLFVTPKEESSATKEPKHNFEAYSFVLKSSEWTKSKIAQAIQEFSESVPRFEHSVALKFSCIGRQRKHEIEQNSFRLYFPHTRLAGCFGNGELGVNHPRNEPNTKQTAKRTKEYLAYEKVHSYSTVFFYIGWGKIIE